MPDMRAIYTSQETKSFESLPMLSILSNKMLRIGAPVWVAESTKTTFNKLLNITENLMSQGKPRHLFP